MFVFFIKNYKIKMLMYVFYMRMRFQTVSLLPGYGRLLVRIYAVEGRG